MKRASVLALGLACTACDAVASLFGSSPPPPPAPEPAPVVEPATPVAEPAEAEAPAPAPAPRPALTADRARARRLAVSEGREAAHGGRHADALAAFDRALAIEPRNPRLLCESGLVAHQAGQDDLAGRRIDAALALFGDDERLPADLRVPVAMCLYNRGLVHQAAHELGEAERAYARSIALRPNAVVSARLAELGDADLAPGPLEDRMSGGVRVSPLGDTCLVHASDEAMLIHALESGLAGVDDFDDGARTQARVERARAPIPLPWEGLTELTLFIVEDGSVPIGSQELVIAAHLSSGGYQVATQKIRYAETNDDGALVGGHAAIGDVAITPETITIVLESCDSDHYLTEVDDGDRILGRADLASCYEHYDSGEQCERALVICGRGTPSMRCAEIYVVQRSPAAEPSATLSCETNAGELLESGLDLDEYVRPRPPFEVRCTAADLDHVRCERVSGTEGADLVGEHTLDALLHTDAAEETEGFLRSDDE